MDYSKLSDFEVNKLIAERRLNLTTVESKSKGRLNSDLWLTDKDGKLKYTNYNPCNDESYSWPIIVESEISIIPPVSNGTNGWKAERFYNENCGKLIDCIDKNPLRAAMIVFLMMSDKK